MYGYGLLLSQLRGLSLVFESQLKGLLVAQQQFIQSLIKRNGKYNNSTDGGTWYPRACTFLHVKRYNHHSSKEKAS